MGYIISAFQIQTTDILTMDGGCRKSVRGTELLHSRYKVILLHFVVMLVILF